MARSQDELRQRLRKVDAGNWYRYANRVARLAMACGKMTVAQEQAGRDAGGYIDAAYDAYCRGETAEAYVASAAFHPGLGRGFRRVRSAAWLLTPDLHIRARRCRFLPPNWRGPRIEWEVMAGPHRVAICATREEAERKVVSHRKRRAMMASQPRIWRDLLVGYA